MDNWNRSENGGPDFYQSSATLHFQSCICTTAVMILALASALQRKYTGCTYIPQVREVNFPSSAMLPKSSDTVDKILQYTAVAADTLQQVANTSQIPFLDSVCTVVLTIVPIVQVRQSDNAFHVASERVVGHEVSKRPRPLDDGKDSPAALCTHELVHLFG
jgi:hypothetical protein